MGLLAIEGALIIIVIVTPPLFGLSLCPIKRMGDGLLRR